MKRLMFDMLRIQYENSEDYVLAESGIESVPVMCVVRKLVEENAVVDLLEYDDSATVKNNEKLTQEDDQKGTEMGVMIKEVNFVADFVVMVSFVGVIVVECFVEE